MDRQEATREVERRLSELRPDAIVLGLGPSAGLINAVDQTLLEGVRFWGVNDVFRIREVHDLVVMDPPQGPLHPSKGRFSHIASARPERIWLYERKCADPWRQVFPKEVHDRIRVFPLVLLPPHNPHQARHPDLSRNPVTHTVSSPCGATAMAWHQGARRIGVLGVDLLPPGRLYRLRGPVSWFFSHISYQAWQQGGRICTLSPETKGKFWKPPWPRENSEQEAFAKAWTTGQPVESEKPSYMQKEVAG